MFFPLTKKYLDGTSKFSEGSDINIEVKNFLLI